MARPKTERHDPLTESMEDYLEEIYDQTNVRQVARVRDIASRLKVSMSSVTGALKKLAQRGLINYDKYQYVTLTDKGRARAAEIKGRHRILTRFLEEALGVGPEKAEANACRMEHALDRDVAARFLAALEFLQTGPRFAPEWTRRFHDFYRDRLAQESSGHAASHAAAEQDLSAAAEGDTVLITRIEDAKTGDSRIARLALLPGTKARIKSNPRGGPIAIRAAGKTITLTAAEGAGVHCRKTGRPARNRPQTRRKANAIQPRSLL